MPRWFLVLGLGLVASLFGCSSESSDGDDGDSSNSGGSSSGGSSSGGSNTGGGGSSATGGSSSGASGASGASGVGGASGSASGGAAGSGAGPAVPPDLGASCNAGCTLTPCATEESFCSTGWCIYESRFLPFEEYCSVACEGPDGPCPADYECVEDEEGGKFWCLKPMPTPPDDFGEPCTATVRANDCFLQDVRRECAPFTHDCDDECVTGPGHPEPVCSMHCSRTLECPEGFDCRDTPVGSTSEMSCFPSYTPEAVLGDACIPDPTLLSLCGAEPASCVMADRYGLCDCLSDERDTTMRDEYCSIPCTGACPSGYECLDAARAPSSMGTGTYCFLVR